MNITKTLYLKDRSQWRKWLSENHDKEKEIWLVNYRKNSGKTSISYNDAVEEAICFGWIDSIVKKFNEESSVQRFSPRNLKSPWSQMNKERARRLIKQGKMMPSGLAKLGNVLEDKFEIPNDILKELKKDKQVWKNFQKFEESYKRIRIGWIVMARKRPEEFKKRLNYFLKMTARNKKFGMVQ